MVKIAGIAASPRKGKTTEFFLQTALRAAKETFPEIETQFYSLANLNFSGCISCDYCKSHFTCSQSDDLSPILEKLKDPSIKGILLATPVYMGGMSSQAKAFLDRSVLFRRNQFHWKNRAGAVISIGGSRNGGQELAQMGAIASFMIHDMVIVGDGSPTAHFGGCGWERVPGGHEKDAPALDAVRSTGVRLAELALKLKD